VLHFHCASGRRTSLNDTRPIFRGLFSFAQPDCVLYSTHESCRGRGTIAGDGGQLRWPSQIRTTLTPWNIGLSIGTYITTTRIARRAKKSWIYIASMELAAKNVARSASNSVKTAVVGKLLPTSGRSVHSSQECTKPAECRGSEGHGRDISLGHAILPLVCHGI